MSHRLTTLILITALALIACSACAVPATPRTPAESIGSSSGSPLAASRSPLPGPAHLVCEPLAFVNLPPSPCAGTNAADPAFNAGGSCVCRNTDYAAVPNGLGKTCVHRNVILAKLSIYADLMQASGVPDPSDRDGFDFAADWSDRDAIVWIKVGAIMQFKHDAQSLLRDGSRLSQCKFERRLVPLQRAAMTFLKERSPKQCIAIVPKGSSGPSA